MAPLFQNPVPKPSITHGYQRCLWCSKATDRDASQPTNMSFHPSALSTAPWDIKARSLATILFYPVPVHWRQLEPRVYRDLPSITQHVGGRARFRPWTLTSFVLLHSTGFRQCPESQLRSRGDPKTIHALWSQLHVKLSKPMGWETCLWKIA